MFRQVFKILTGIKSYKKIHVHLEFSLSDCSVNLLNLLNSLKEKPKSSRKLRCLQIQPKKFHNQYTSCRWSMSGLNINKIVKNVVGNRNQHGYKFAIRNCGRGLLQDDYSTKLTEIKQYIESKRPHSLGIIEADLFGTNLQSSRKKYTTEEIKAKLMIDGYNLELPTSWNTYGQARIICYVSEDVKYNRKIFNDEHIPSITLEIGLGKASKTLVHYFYREWKNGVTGESDSESQVRHLQQHIAQWKQLTSTGRQVVALGDANVCALQWNEPNYRNKILANEIQTFLLEESCFQMVNKYTRVQNVAGKFQYSCLDHIYSNVPEKCNVPEFFSSMSSDHLPVTVTKCSRELRVQPKTIKKRQYKNFSPYHFLSEVYECEQLGGFSKVTNSSDIEEASANFSEIFGNILNNHAPLKVIQVRKNYVP